MNPRKPSSLYTLFFFCSGLFLNSAILMITFSTDPTVRWTGIAVLVLAVIFLILGVSFHAAYANKLIRHYHCCSSSTSISAHTSGR